MALQTEQIRGLLHHDVEIHVANNNEVRITIAGDARHLCEEHNLDFGCSTSDEIIGILMEALPLAKKT